VRQSPRKSKARREVETPTDEHAQDEKVVSTEEQVDGTPIDEETPVSSRSARASARESRKKRGGDLRAKSVGLVGKIDTEQTSGKKIVFGEDLTLEEEMPATAATTKNDQKDDGDDEDDNVEEVKASEAKEQVLGQIQQERKTAGVLQKLDTKRKRKIVEEQVEDMDEDFFAQVDVELDRERKEKKQVTVVPKGKRTTFMAKEEKDYAVEREHNIEVVVLGPDAAVAAASGTKPSEAALLFSRSRLQNGISTIKKTGVSKKKPAKKEGWKRSKKMTRVLISGKHQRRSKPAAHFVIKA
jgi:hypothetical protein